MKKKNIYIWYLAIVLALSYLWQLAIFRTGGVQSPLFTFLMWIHPGSIRVPDLGTVCYPVGMNIVGIYGRVRPVH